MNILMCGALSQSGSWLDMKKTLVLFAFLIVPALLLLSIPEPARSLLAVGVFLGALVLFALGRADPSWRDRLY